MLAAAEGKSECLLALIHAKADTNLQSKVRWSGRVLWVWGFNTDYLVLDLGLEQHRHYHRIIWPKCLRVPTCPEETLWLF